MVDYITVEHLKIPTDNKAIKKIFEPIDKEKYYRPSSLRNLELKKEEKYKNIMEIKNTVRKTKIGVGDNDLHYLSDSNCCCGVDTINDNFNNYLKYNLTYFTISNITEEQKEQLYTPESSVSSVLNPDTRIKNMNSFKDYVDVYCRKKNEFMCENCPLKEKYKE